MQQNTNVLVSTGCLVDHHNLAGGVIGCVFISQSIRRRGKILSNLNIN